MFSTYRPPRQLVEYLFKDVGYAWDTYGKAYEKVFLAVDFDTEETEPCLSKFLTSYDSKSLVKDKPCFKNLENLTCIDLFIRIVLAAFKK